MIKTISHNFRNDSALYKLLEKFGENFEKISDVKLKSGLTIKTIEVDGNVELDELQQGVFYELNGGVTDITIDKYISTNNKIMGEFAIKFKPESSFNISVKNGSNIDKLLIEFDNDLDIIPGYEYHLKFITNNIKTENNKYKLYCKINRFSDIDVIPNGHIKITYNEYSEKFFNMGWFNENKEYIQSIYYKLEDQWISIKNNPTYLNGKPNSESEVRINFGNFGKISLKNIMKGVSFDTFVTDGFGERYIINMDYAFADGDYTSYIDLTGFKTMQDSDNSFSCEGLFKNRKFRDISDKAEYINIYDENIGTGIQLDKLNSMSHIFNGCITDSDRFDNIITILEKSTMNNCSNYSYAFAHCDLSSRKCNWNWYRNTLNRKIDWDLSYMFKGATLNNTLFESILKLLSSDQFNDGTMVDFNNMFSEAKFADNWLEKWEIVLDKKCIYNMQSMFAQCLNLQMPTIILNTDKTVDFDNMFNGSEINNIEQLGLWEIRISNSNINLSNMFAESIINNYPNKITVFNKSTTFKSSMGQLDQMFNGVIDGNGKILDVPIYLNINVSSQSNSHGAPYTTYEFVSTDTENLIYIQRYMVDGNESPIFLSLRSQYGYAEDGGRIADMNNA